MPLSKNKTTVTEQIEGLNFEMYYGTAEHTIEEIWIPAKKK
ncbi:hypothetical protein [Paenibacillus sp. FSL K6-0108]